MKKTENRIDAYIEKNGDDYDMYFQYNDLKYTSLYKDNHAKDLAIIFKTKYLKSNAKIINHGFTDDHGKEKDKVELTTVLSSIKGIKDIDNAITGLVMASVHPEVNSDLTIHLYDKEYPIVGKSDRKEFFSADILKTNDKGLSVEQFDEITNDLNLLKDEMNCIQYQKKAV